MCLSHIFENISYRTGKLFLTEHIRCFELANVITSVTKQCIAVIACFVICYRRQVVIWSIQIDKSVTTVK